MALVSCPECSKEISDRAAACPHCGCFVPSSAVGKGALSDAEILEALARGDRIAAIKLYREHNPGTDLAEAKRQVEEVERTLPPGSTPRRRGCGAAAVAVLLAATAAVILWAR